MRSAKCFQLTSGCGFAASLGKPPAFREAHFDVARGSASLVTVRQSLTEERIGLHRKAGGIPQGGGKAANAIGEVLVKRNK